MKKSYLINIHMVALVVPTVLGKYLYVQMSNKDDIELCGIVFLEEVIVPKVQ